MRTRGPAAWHATRAAALAIAVWLASGCAGRQSALNPAGPQAGRIVRLWWLYCGVGAAVYVVVMLLVVSGLMRHGRRDALDEPVMTPPAAQERRLMRAVGGALALTIGILFVLLIGDFATGLAIRDMSEPDALTIRVTGHQWWWEVQYQDATPSQIVTTANEIHIPIGRTVRVELRSSDVIHSFWVPNLHGKRDMIPGHPTRIFLKADRPGTFQGQCAEFCGLQHAYMRLAVVAEPEEEFGRWLDAQRRPAPPPTTEGQRRGERVFLNATCIMCHSIRGTPAGGRVGPDLTHLGSRSLIGGILPNARGHLAGWIVDPQQIKPGVRMPMNPVKPDELDALVDYLESLK